MRRLFILACVSAALAACSSNGSSPEAVEAAADSSYYFVFLNTNPDRPELPQAQVDSLQAGHMANISRLYHEDKLDVAGPLEGGGGIFLLKAPDPSEAQQYIDSDPAIQAGRFRIELYPFEFAAGSVCTVAEDAEMAQYGFIRLHEAEGGDGSADNTEQRDALSDSGELIFSGWFDGTDAGVMIVRSTADSLLQNIASAHPGVANGHLTPEIKRIWVGKGVFCE